MTNKELINLQDTPEGRKVLSEYLAELTVPKPWVHDLHIPSKEVLFGGSGFQTYTCRRCGTKQGIDKGEVGQFLKGNECPKPDPIYITTDKDDPRYDACLGMAVRMFREAIKTQEQCDTMKMCINDAYELAMKPQCEVHELSLRALRWFTGYATAFELFKIIALAIKEKPNE
jgi:hypothetical protein